MKYPIELLIQELADEAAAVRQMNGEGFAASPEQVLQRIAELPQDLCEDVVRTSFAALVAYRQPVLLLPDHLMPKDAAEFDRLRDGDRLAAEQARARAARARAARARGELPDGWEQLSLLELERRRTAPPGWYAWLAERGYPPVIGNAESASVEA